MQAVIHSIQEEAVTLGWSDGSTTRFPAVWLRDNIPAGRHRPHGQRTFDINDIEPPRIQMAELSGAELSIRFADVTDKFPLTWLEEVAISGVDGGRPIPQPEFWDSSLELEPFPYSAVDSDPGERLTWLRQIRDPGSTVLEGAPVTPGTVTDVADCSGSSGRRTMGGSST